MRALYLLAAGMFTMGCDNFVVAGLLPGLSASLGTSIALTVQGITAFSFTYLVCAPLFALLLAGRPARQVLILALAVFTVGNLMTLASSSFWFYLLSRAIAGCGAGMYSPVAVGSVAGLVEPEARGRAIGMIWGANSAGAVLGVPLGLWLAHQWDWRATIVLILLLGIFTLLGIAAVLPPCEVVARPSLPEQVRSLVNPRVLSVIGVTCLTATASLGMYEFILPLQAGTGNSGDAALTLWNIGGLIGTNLVGHVADRLRNPRLLMAAILAILAAVFLSLPSLHGLPGLGLVPFLLWGALGWATMTPQIMSLIELEPGRESTLVALNGSALGLGGVLGPALGGLALAEGLAAHFLPYAASAVLLAALAWQGMLALQWRPAVQPA